MCASRGRVAVGWVSSGRWRVISIREDLRKSSGSRGDRVTRGKPSNERLEGRHGRGIAERSGSGWAGREEGFS